MKGLVRLTCAVGGAHALAVSGNDAVGVPTLGLVPSALDAGVGSLEGGHDVAGEEFHAAVHLLRGGPFVDGYQESAGASGFVEEGAELGCDIVGVADNPASISDHLLRRNVFERLVG